MPNPTSFDPDTRPSWDWQDVHEDSARPWPRGWPVVDDGGEGQRHTWSLPGLSLIAPSVLEAWSVAEAADTAPMPNPTSIDPNTRPSRGWQAVHEDPARPWPRGWAVVDDGGEGHCYAWSLPGLSLAAPPVLEARSAGEAARQLIEVGRSSGTFSSTTAVRTNRRERVTGRSTVRSRRCSACPAARAAAGPRRSARGRPNGSASRGAIVTPVHPGTPRCRFLVDGACSVYARRPFACRLYGTSPVARCERGARPDPTLELPVAKAISLTRRFEAGCPPSWHDDRRRAAVRTLVERDGSDAERRALNDHRERLAALSRALGLDER